MTFTLFALSKSPPSESASGESESKAGAQHSSDGGPVRAKEEWMNCYWEELATMEPVTQWLLFHF